MMIMKSEGEEERNILPIWGNKTHREKSFGDFYLCPR